MPLNLFRTLRRDIVIEGDVPPGRFRFLEAQPTVPFAEARATPVTIQAHADGLFRAECSWGPRVEGSDRTLERRFEALFNKLAVADEGSALVLFATVVRLGSVRLALFGGDGDDRSLVSLALLMQGAAFEGDGIAFLTGDGVAAHPRKPCISCVELPPWLDGQWAARSSRDLHGRRRAFDPSSGGQPWSLSRTSIQAFAFLDSNAGGRSAIGQVRFPEALRRIMRHSGAPPTKQLQAQVFAALHAQLAAAHHLRVSVGQAVDAAELILARLACAA